HGLARIEESDREGIITLLNKASVTTFTATTLAFTLVPRINATGRMGSPNRAVELLITEYPDQAALLAEDICEDNERRKEIEKEITEEAITMIERDDTLKFSRILVLDGENWHGGVLGIVASKIVERFGKPTVIISRTGDEAKGSGRSVEGFSLFEAIRDCGAALLRFGGHPMAAGVTLCADKINEFRTKINAYAKIKADYMPAPSVTVECKLLPGALGVEIPQMLTVMEPFGSGNPYPVFGLFSMVLEGITPVGGGNHLRLNFRRDSVAVTCMKFGCRQENFPYKIGTPLDLAVILEAKEFKGAQNLTVMIKEMKPSGLSMDNCVRTYKSYEKYKRGEIMGTEELAVITPTRNDLADIYRLLRAEGGWKLSALQLLALLPKQDITLGKIMIALEILQERNLITFSGEELLYVSLIPATHKVDIFDSAVYKTLKSLTKE
ncbi:MAG: DHHA1 domain-containing protein, partial [Oscillospiraceae bacterium]